MRMQIGRPKKQQLGEPNISLEILGQPNNNKNPKFPDYTEDLTSSFKFETMHKNTRTNQNQNFLSSSSCF